MIFCSNEYERLRKEANLLRGLSSAEKKEKAEDVVLRYLIRPAQGAGRTLSGSYAEEAGRAITMRAEVLLDAARSGYVAQFERLLPKLLNDAERDPFAYRIARPFIGELVSMGITSPALRDFIARDYRGEINPRSKRRTKPADKRRSIQAHLAVRALMEIGISENSSLSIVAKASLRAGIEYPQAFSDDPVTKEHIRSAHRKHRGYYDQMLGGTAEE